MKAAILAAGQGKRLGKLGASTPKGLLQIGQGPIIERSIRLLLSQTIQEICVVVGFRAEAFSYLEELFPGVSLVKNPDFERHGSMRSLALAFEWAQSDLVVLDSDIVYGSSGLEALLALSGKNSVLLSGPTGAGDEVWAYGTSKRVSKLTKDSLDFEGIPVGEFVGISFLQSHYLDVMVSMAKGPQDDVLRDYEHYMSQVSTELELEPCLVPGLAWAEIDNLQQLRRASTVVFPELDVV